MPSESKAQQHLMQAAEHGADFPMAKQLRQSMTHEQMHDFAVGSEQGKPEHVSHDRGKNLGHFLHGKGGMAQLKAHAATHGHANHADAYAAGALAQRKGEHQHRDKHPQALQHAASSHGYTGNYATAYADGAMNEMNGMHTDDEDDAK